MHRLADILLGVGLRPELCSRSTDLTLGTRTEITYTRDGVCCLRPDGGQCRQLIEIHSRRQFLSQMIFTASRGRVGHYGQARQCVRTTADPPGLLCYSGIPIPFPRHYRPYFPCWMCVRFPAGGAWKRGCAISLDGMSTLVFGYLPLGKP